MNWTVYLSGEIHTDWRQQIKDGVREKGLPNRAVNRKNPVKG